jgi:hypothetical protein
MWLQFAATFSKIFENAGRFGSWGKIPFLAVLRQLKKRARWKGQGERGLANAKELKIED